MDYADAIRRQAEDVPRAALPAVTAALWRAFGEGHVTEAEAEALSALIEARQVFPDPGIMPGESAFCAPHSGDLKPGKSRFALRSPEQTQDGRWLTPAHRSQP